MCSTTEGDLLLQQLKQNELSVHHRTSVTLMQLPTTPCMIGGVCLAYRLRMIQDRWCNLFAISHAKRFMFHLAVLGKVVFGVTVEQGEFPNFVFELPTSNNEVLLEDVEKRLRWHNPPLRLKTVNNVPATARPSNKTLVANFKDGDRLELVADIAPGDSA